MFNIIVCVKVKQSHYTPWRRLGGALDGGEWSASRPCHALPPGRGPTVPIGQEAGWASELVWTQRQEKKLLPLLGIEPLSPRSWVHSQTLYWLSYPGSYTVVIVEHNITIVFSEHIKPFFSKHRMQRKREVSSVKLQIVHHSTSSELLAYCTCVTVLYLSKSWSPISLFRSQLHLHTNTRCEILGHIKASWTLSLIASVACDTMNH
jgi:hypothetical protein